MLSQENIPEHVGFIMDGNRRWARQRKLPVALGHRAGVRSFRRIMDECRRLQIPYVTCYAFSELNWDRSPFQVETLMSIFQKYAVRERERLLRTGVRLRMVGYRDGLPNRVLSELLETESLTRNNTGMVLNLAVNYSSQSEVVRTTKALLHHVRDKDLDPDSLDYEQWAQYSDFPNQPDCDLLIRTSGERRLSDFLLIQSAYAELFFLDKMWPDFTVTDLHEILQGYSQRNRRFGGGRGW